MFFSLDLPLLLVHQAPLLKKLMDQIHRKREILFLCCYLGTFHLFPQVAGALEVDNVINMPLNLVKCTRQSMD